MIAKILDLRSIKESYVRFYYEKIIFTHLRSQDPWWKINFLILICNSLLLPSFPSLLCRLITEYLISHLIFTKDSTIFLVSEVRKLEHQEIYTAFKGQNQDSNLGLDGSTYLILIIKLFKRRGCISIFSYLPRSLASCNLLFALNISPNLFSKVTKDW